MCLAIFLPVLVIRRDLVRGPRDGRDHGGGGGDQAQGGRGTTPGHLRDQNTCQQIGRDQGKNQPTDDFRPAAHFRHPVPFLLAVLAGRIVLALGQGFRQTELPTEPRKSHRHR